MLNRPPPYFPQGQLSPPDPKRYRRLKLIIAGVIAGGIAVLAVAGYLIYLLVNWFSK